MNRQVVIIHPCHAEWEWLGVGWPGMVKWDNGEPVKMDSSVNCFVGEKDSVYLILIW